MLKENLALRQLSETSPDRRIRPARSTPYLPQGYSSGFSSPYINMPEHYGGGDGGGHRPRSAPRDRDYHPGGYGNPFDGPPDPYMVDPRLAHGSGDHGLF